MLGEGVEAEDVILVPKEELEILCIVLNVYQVIHEIVEGTWL